MQGVRLSAEGQEELLEVWPLLEAKLLCPFEDRVALRDQSRLPIVGLFEGDKLI